MHACHLVAYCATPSKHLGVKLRRTWELARTSHPERVPQLAVADVESVATPRHIQQLSDEIRVRYLGVLNKSARKLLSTNRHC